MTRPEGSRRSQGRDGGVPLRRPAAPYGRNNGRVRLTAGDLDAGLRCKWCSGYGDKYQLEVVGIPTHKQQGEKAIRYVSPASYGSRKPNSP